MATGGRRFGLALTCLALAGVAGLAESPGLPPSELRDPPRAAARTTGLVPGSLWEILANPAIRGVADRSRMAATAFFQMIAPWAHEERRLYGTPESVTMGQAVWESGWGESGLSVTYHNFHGMKDAWGKERQPNYASGSVDLCNSQGTDCATYNTYPSGQESFLDHGWALANYGRYSATRQYLGNPSEFLRVVAEAGYASASGYYNNVKGTMDYHNLYQYDTAQGGGGSGVPQTSTGFYYPTGDDTPYIYPSAFFGATPGDGYFSNRWHCADDIAANQGDPVYAVAEGDVVTVSTGGWGTGNVGLIVKHRCSNGRYFLAVYGHITNYATGHVLPGQQIGKIGYWSNGIHLHFGVYESADGTGGYPVIDVPNGYGWGMRAMPRPAEEWIDGVKSYDRWMSPTSYIRTRHPYGGGTPTDSSPPFGAIDWPSANESFSGWKDCSGWAIDYESGVSRVELLVDGNRIGDANYPTNRDDGNPGWTFRWDSSTVSAGSHTFTCRLTNGAGLTASIDRTINVIGANQAPNPPTNLRESINGLSVTFQWDDGGDPDNGPRNYRTYVVDVYNSSGNFIKSSGWVESGTSWAWTVPAAGDYSWDVRASDSALDSAKSSRKYFNIANRPPNPPINLRETVDGLNVSFAWDDGGDPDNGPRNYRTYVVDVFNSDGGLERSSGWVENGTTWSWQASRPGSYSWDVRASDSALTGDRSARRSFSIANRAPNPPELLLPESGYASVEREVTFSWLDGGDVDNYPWDHRDYHVVVVNADGHEVGSRPYNGDASTTWTWTAPAAGDYRWRVQSGDGDKPSTWTAEWPFTILPSHWLSAGLHCLGVPVDLPAATPAAVLGGYDWQMATYEPASGAFRSGQTGAVPAGCRLLRGEAVWLWLPTAQTLLLPSLGQHDANFDLPLTRGWNNLGNPYDADLPWTPETIQVLQHGQLVGTLDQPVAQALVMPYAWTFDSSRRRHQIVADQSLTFAQHAIPAMAGFWLRALADEVTVRLAPPGQGQRRATAGQADGREWSIRLRAAAAGEAGEVTVGVTTVPGRAAEFSEPPSPVAQPTPLVTIAGLEGDVVTGSFRQWHPGAQRWELNLQRATPGEVTLSWPALLRDLPRGVVLELEDLNNGQRLVLNTRASYRVDVPQDGRRLRLTARTGNLARSEIVALSGQASRSRGASLSLTLSGPAEVTVTVRGLGGKLVRTMHEAVTAGSSSWLWDGLDEQGRPVPRGVYQIEAVAVSANGAVSRAVRTVTVN